jgi:hypothetical protein
MRLRVIAAVVVLLVIAGASPALAAKGGQAKVDTLTTQTGTVLAGDSAWIEIVWEASGGDAEDFQVTVKNPDPGWEVRYPDNTGSYSSTWGDSTLSDGEIDFTAIHVTVPYAAGKDVKLHLEASYVSDGTSHSQSFQVKVPVAEYTGNDLSQVGGDTTIDGSGWVQVPFMGNAPRLDGFQMTASPPGGLTVSYPGDGSFTSLAHDARLEDGESDYAAFYVDATDAEPDTYTIPLQVTYFKDSLVGTWDGSITITVQPTPGGD